MDIFDGQKKILVIFLKKSEAPNILYDTQWSDHNAHLVLCFLVTLKILFFVPGDECGCKSGLR